MKSYIVFSVLLIVVLVIGCAQQMPPEKIVAEIQRCEVAGLDAKPINNGLYRGEVTNIVCVMPRGRLNR